MAQRRMFSKTITNSSQFLMMPHTSQMLYFHLGMNADDEGYVESLMILRMSNCNEQDIKILEANGFIKIFNNLIIVITDWRENNWIRPDRMQESGIKNKIIDAEQLALLPENKRENAYKNSSLPYSFSYKIKQEYIGKQCAICGEEMGPSGFNKKFDGHMPSIDHIIPISQGGTHEIDNIRIVHLKCNISRKNNATDIRQKDVCQVSDICHPQVRLGKGIYTHKEKNCENVDKLWTEKITPHLGKYAPSMIKAFENHWRQRNDDDAKELWQMEEIFDVQRRLETWKDRDEKWEYKKNSCIKNMP